MTARWVPILLSGEEKRIRVEKSTVFLIRWERGDAYLHVRPHNKLWWNLDRASDTWMTLDFNVGFEELEHNLYSPDLAPMDFAVFPKLKYQLKGREFRWIEEMRMAVRSFFWISDESW